MKNEIYIGIDPGVKTGVAVWNKDSQKFDSIDTYPHVKAFIWIHEYIKHMILKDIDIHLVIEDANQKGSWGVSAMSIGKLKQKSMDWIELGEFHDINVVKVNPKSRRNTKMKSDYFKKLTGYEHRTSEHSRDAAMLVFDK